MKITELSLSGLKLVQPDVFRDERGFLLESYNEKRYQASGIDSRFVQDNHSSSVMGTLRGIHYQSVPGQDKLVRVVKGRIFDVAVDLRPESTTFGKWQGIYLDAEQHLQLFIPRGFGHGFCVVSDRAEVLYKLSSFYDPRHECTVRWDDPDLGIGWPVADPIVSERDRDGEPFAELRRRVLA